MAQFGNIGKELLVIDRTAIADEVEHVVFSGCTGLVPTNEEHQYTDHVRIALGRYWAKNKEHTDVTYLTDPFKAPLDHMKATTPLYNPETGKWRQWIRFKFNGKTISETGETIPEVENKESWIAWSRCLTSMWTQLGLEETGDIPKINWIDGGTPASLQRVMFDLAHKVHIALSDKEAEKYGNISNVLRVDIEPMYNFTSKIFEDAVEDAEETLLPNVFTDASQENTWVLNSVKPCDWMAVEGGMWCGTSIKGDMAINGISGATGLEGLVIDWPGNTPETAIEFDPDISEAPLDWNSWAVDFSEMIASLENINAPGMTINQKTAAIKKEIAQLLAKKEKNILFPLETLSFINETYHKRFLYPMLFDIQIPTINASFSWAQMDGNEVIEQPTMFGLLKSTLTYQAFMEWAMLLTVPYDLPAGYDLLYKELAKTLGEEAWPEPKIFIKRFFTEFGETAADTSGISNKIIPSLNERSLRNTAGFDDLLGFKSVLDATLLSSEVSPDTQAFLNLKELILNSGDDVTGTLVIEDPNNPGQKILSPTFGDDWNLIATSLKGIFDDEYNNLVDYHFRHWGEIVGIRHTLAGDTTPKPLAYSETLFYRIEKSLVTFPGGAPGLTGDTPAYENIQNIYLPNTNELDVIKYLDTQVKYGKRYRYRIFSYQCVIGTKYNYLSGVKWDPLPKVTDFEGKSPQFPTKDDLNLEILKQQTIDWLQGEGGAPPPAEDAPAAAVYADLLDGVVNSDHTDRVDGQHGYVFLPVEYEPSVQLVESLYHEWEGPMLDNPPVPPRVDIYPYAGINNKLLILFQDSTGEFLLDPIALNSDDEAAIEIIRDAQKIADGPILFKSDDAAENFEIYKIGPRKSSSPLATKPRSYRDFKQLTPITVKDTAYVDTIVPNRKYYYTFRTKDIHGHFSNPTAVYEIEMVDTGNSIYPVITTIDMDPQPSLEDTTKPVRKYLYIAPALEQTVINNLEAIEEFDTVEPAPQPILGLDEKSVWGKKLKIKLISKSTGKEININVQFRTKHVG